MSTVLEILSAFRNKLEGLYEKGELEQIIQYSFEHCCSYSRADILLRYSEPLDEDQSSELKMILRELEEGKPIQYILGYSWFMDRKFKVNPNVLIPRQETEELVHWIIQDNQEKSNSDLKVLDVCTGSACISISLSLEQPNWNVNALDISAEALEIAKENNKLLASNVNFFCSDFLHWNEDKTLTSFNMLLKDTGSGLDMIVSNPPYVLEKEKAFLHSRVLEHEPGIALFVPDNDPFIFYRKIADFGIKTLKPGGKIYLEINRAYAKDIARIFHRAEFKDVRIRKDLLDNDRMISVTFIS